MPPTLLTRAGVSRNASCRQERLKSMAEDAVDNGKKKISKQMGGMETTVRPTMTMTQH